jgi:alanyl aminopeptidase
VCLRHGSKESAQSAPAEDAPAAEQCVLIDTPSAELALTATSCPRWLFPNAMASGYYRWSLAPADFDALLTRGFGALGTGERLSLLSNTEAGARAGEQSFEQLMAVTRKVGRERPRELVLGALGVLTRIREALLTEAELPSYRRLTRSMVFDRAQELGLFPAGAREDGDKKLLRPGVVAALAFEAWDGAARAELHQLGLARLGMREDRRHSRLPAELLDVALGVAVQEGGAPVIERAISALRASNDGIERGRLLSALGQNRNPEHSALVLALSLGDELRTNERAAPISGQIRHPETRDATYAWVEQHFDALVARLGADNAAPLVHTVGAFCDEGRAARAQQFFGPRVGALPGGPRVLRLNIESVELCSAFARAHREAAKKYFAPTAAL